MFAPHIQLLARSPPQWIQEEHCSGRFIAGIETNEHIQTHTHTYTHVRTPTPTHDVPKLAHVAHTSPSTVTMSIKAPRDEECTAAGTREHATHYAVHKQASHAYICARTCAAVII